LRPTNSEAYLDEQTALQEGKLIASKEGRRWISKEQALYAVEAYTRKTDKSVNGLVPILCEQVLLWRIIYDDIGVEYVIDKNFGTIISERKLPLESLVGSSATNAPRSDAHAINKRQAVEIARRDFSELLRLYGSSPDHINEYTPFACELKNAWRIAFEYRRQPWQKITELPNTNPPLYLIDKKTGSIVDRVPPMRPSDIH